MPEKFILRQCHIYLLVVLGTVTRLFFGIYTEAWLGSPDQLAWGLALEDGAKNGFEYYRQLIHYPHEGGSFLMSLMALCLRPLDSLMPALSIAALLTDTISRFIQIIISKRLFGPVTAGWFGLWTILGVPLLLPWATVNFGLHSLASFLPFLFLYTAIRHENSRFAPLYCGIVAGLSVSFSYDCAVFVPAYLCWMLFSKGEQKLLRCVKFLAAFMLAMVPHILSRTITDTGFRFEQLSVLSLHNLAWIDIFNLQNLKLFMQLWYRALPVSLFLNSVEFFSLLVTRLIIATFCLGGIALAIFKNTVSKKTISLGLLILVLFLLAYSFSPFYATFHEIGSYVYFRHFSFIIPLLVVIMLNGFTKTVKAHIFLAGFWIIMCGIFSVTYFTSFKPVSPAYRAAGWMLARKYGEADALIRIRSLAPAVQRNELMTGFGWGLSTAILDRKNSSDREAVDLLCTMYRKIPPDLQPRFMEGIHFSFREGITPVLDPALLPLIDSCQAND